MLGNYFFPLKRLYEASTGSYILWLSGGKLLLEMSLQKILLDVQDCLNYKSA
ncbi:MAG: hypothetical protein ACJAZH_001544 [Roseivirga sp.]|jgi:hypothetical protein